MLKTCKLCGKKRDDNLEVEIRNKCPGASYKYTYVYIYIYMSMCYGSVCVTKILA